MSLTIGAYLYSAGSQQREPASIVVNDEQFSHNQHRENSREVWKKCR